MKRLLFPLTLFALTLLPLSFIRGAQVSSSWVGGDNGTYFWETDSYWSPSPSGKSYPNNLGSDQFLTTIGNSTGNRLIETSGTITVSRLFMTQSSTEGSITLKLGGDFTVANDTGSNSSFTNSTNNASKFVIDLNGHRFDVKSVANTLGSIPYFTLTGGGTYSLAQLYHSTGEGTIGANVLVDIHGTSVYAQYLAKLTWDSTSTLKFGVNNASKTTIYHSVESQYGIGNLIVGDRENTVGTWAGFSSAALYVKGDLSILSYQNAVAGGAAKMTIGDTAKFYVAGNFTDEGSDLEDYGKGTFLFNGGRSTERVLSTGRANLSTSFQVGEITATPGNLRLGQNLTTTGKITVLKESRLNVDQFTVKAGTLDLQSTASIKPTLAFTFGLNGSGMIESTKTLSLGYAIIDLTYDGTGWQGGDLVLFKFNSISGTAPSLANLMLNLHGGFSSDGLVIGDHSIYLSNVVVPEPTTVALLASGGFLLWGLGRRSIRKRTRV